MELLDRLAWIDEHYFMGWMERQDNVELLEKWGHDGNVAGDGILLLTGGGNHYQGVFENRGY